MKKKILYVICDNTALRRFRRRGWGDDGEFKRFFELWAVIRDTKRLARQGMVDLTRWKVVEINISHLGAWNMGSGVWEAMAPVGPEDFGQDYPAYTLIA